MLKKLPLVGSIVHVLISYDISEYRVIKKIGNDEIKVIHVHDNSNCPLEHTIKQWWERVEDIPEYLLGGAC